MPHGQLLLLMGLLLVVGWGDAKAGSASYSYDALGRLTTVVNLNGPNVGYQYDALGNFITRMVAPPPSGPPNINATSIGAGSVTFTFAPPSTNTGAPITGYVVNCSPGSLVSSVGPDATVIAVTGLAKGATYTCTLAANSIVGPGISSPVQTVVGGSQTIAFGSLESLIVGVNSVVPVTASSGLPVIVTSTTPSVCSVVSGSTVRGVVAGSCTLNVAQAGDSNFLAATPVSTTLQVVNPATLLMIFTDD